MSLHVLYGGTFDPVHLGHLAIATAARDFLATRIAMMPASDPPHRATPGAPAEARAAMLELAVADVPGLYVDRRELLRDAPSFSIDTLRDLRREVGTDVPVALLVGADSFRGLAHWHQWPELFENTHFVVAERQDAPLDRRLDGVLDEALAGRWTRDPQDLARTPAGRVLRLCQPLHAASATSIRRAIASGGGWRHDVPPAVAAYIDLHGLYREDRGIGAPL